ncbi:nucleoside/nucleotide kinase family protein [Nocardioides sp. GXZ039]|uniref:nucleoside/nucleotide kinase family protein n=1 Tax=Nocardioides sp. GXZ039 TaxID=3136018 RepID=UPI0030F452AD
MTDAPVVAPALADGELAALLDRARALGASRERRVLGIAGAPGSGKSTLTDALLAGLRGVPPVGRGADWVAHLPMDGYHLADEQLARLGLLDRKGAPETFDVDGYVATLQRLRSGASRPVYVPGFERELEQPIAAALVVPPEADLVVTEGNYLLLDDGGWEHVRGALDEIWFVDVDQELRIARLIARHVRFGKSPEAAHEWVHRSDEANARLVEAARARADLVVRLG